MFMSFISPMSSRVSLDARPDVGQKVCRFAPLRTIRFPST